MSNLQTLSNDLQSLRKIVSPTLLQRGISIGKRLLSENNEDVNVDDIVTRMKNLLEKSGKGYKYEIVDPVFDDKFQAKLFMGKRETGIFGNETSNEFLIDIFDKLIGAYRTELDGRNIDSDQFMDMS